MAVAPRPGATSGVLAAVLKLRDSGRARRGVTRGPLASRVVPFGPRPGDRVPNLGCLRPDGVRTRLHAELGGRRAVLAADDSADACVTAAGEMSGNHLVGLAPVDGGSGEVLEDERADRQARNPPPRVRRRATRLSVGGPTRVGPRA